MITVPLSFILGVYIAKWLGGNDQTMFFTSLIFAFIAGVVDNVWYLHHQKEYNMIPDVRYSKKKTRFSFDVNEDDYRGRF
jgi:hypothetical protein